jgi:MFS family permease
MASAFELAILLLGSLTLGNALVYSSNALSSLHRTFQLSARDDVTFLITLPLSATFGPFLANWLLNFDGRRFAVRILALLAAAAWVLLLAITPRSHGGLFAHRILLGLSVGGFSSLIPMYIMELFPRDRRTVSGAAHSIGVAIGIIYTSSIGAFFPWAPLAYTSLPFPIFLLAAIGFVPEPDSLHTGPTGGSRSADTLCGKYSGSLLLILGIMFVHQASGFYSILGSLTFLLQSGPRAAIVVSALLFGTFTSVFTSTSRKVLWSISLFGSALSIVLFAIYRTSVAGVFFAAAYFFCFGLNLAFLPWVLPFQAFPESLRPRAMAIVTSVNWIVAAGIVEMYFGLLSFIGTDLVLMFSALMCLFGGGFGMTVVDLTVDPGAAAVYAQAVDPVPGFASVMVDLSD